MEIKFNDGKTVGGGSPPYIVAEVNSSHNGSVDAAKRMIDAAAAAGCDCVKFQSFTPESLYSKSYYKENPVAKRFVSKFSFGGDKLKECADYCRRKGVSFASTPYSDGEVDFLAGVGVPFIKIASMEVNNLPFLGYIARKGLPIVLSTGMAGAGEVVAAVRAIESAGGGQIVLLHCVSVYPVPADGANLNNIRWLQSAFPYPVGYSDHTIGCAAATGAVAMGASLVEKHLTLDRAKIGMDNQMATEPEDMALLVRNCHEVHAALGQANRSVSPGEMAQRKNMRRSLVYARDLPAGAALAAGDMLCKRPGTGFEPGQLNEFVGKTLARGVEGDTLLSAGDFE